MSLNRRAGLSLVELLFSMALLAISAAIAVPVFADLIERNRQLALQVELRSALQVARAQAVIEGRSVEVCGSRDGLSCSPGWSDGWLIRAARTQEPFRVRHGDGLKGLAWSGFGTSILFRGNGSSPISNGRFFQCHQGRVAWQLILNRQGRVREASFKENQAEQGRCAD